MTAMDIRGSVDLSAHGIESTGVVLWNPSTPMLYEHAIAGRGAHRRGRPDGRRHRHAHRPLAAGQVHRPRAELRGPHLVGREQGDRRGARSTTCARRSSSSSRARPTLYVIDAFAGADPAHRIAVRVITTHPYHALFAKTMFIDPTRGGVADVHAAGARAARARARGRSRRRTARAPRTFIVLHPGRTEVLIGGTFYAGEIKKSIFTVMNDRLPLEGVLPMHCSANVGADGRSAIFFGLSGTGKTTLSADPGARADRRRRARLGRQRRLQLRGRLLREGDPPLGRGRAGDLQDDAHVRDDPRERRRSTSAASSTSTTPRRPRTRAPPTSSSRSRTRMPDEARPAIRARS